MIAAVDGEVMFFENFVKQEVISNGLEVLVDFNFIMNKYKFFN